MGDSADFKTRFYYFGHGEHTQTQKYLSNGQDIPFWIFEHVSSVQKS